MRKREKLKRRELQLYKEEWAARMQGEAAWLLARLPLDSCGAGSAAGVAWSLPRLPGNS